MPTKYRVEITNTAETDLLEIWNYIASESTVEAAKFVLRIEEKIATLERMPFRCPAIPENALLGTDYRHLVVDHYRVIFRLGAKRVYVLRILHGARLLDSSSLND